MQSPAEICNLALGEIGNTAFIADLEDPTEEGRVAKTIYDHCLRFALKKCEPKFARKRTTLNQVVNGSRTNWAFAYTLPNDFIHMVEVIVNGSVLPVPEVRYEYDIEGQVLLSNMETLEITYTAYTAETGKFSEDFVEALQLFIASKFAAALKKDRPFALELQERALAIASDVRAKDKNHQDIQKLEPLTPSHRARL